MDEPRVRFPWGLTVVSALAFALLVSLGVWQVNRLQWKEGLIAEAEAATARSPVPLVDLVGRPAEFSRVVVHCDFQHDIHRHVELQSIHDGVAGVRLVSACDGYLVDLGFIDGAVSARPTQTAFRAPRAPTAYPAVVAEVRETPPPNAMAPPPQHGRFFARDNVAIGETLGVPEANRSLTLYAVESAFPGFDALTPSAPPAAFSNNHLGYAITWFGLALALAGFYIAMLRRKLKP